MLRASGARASHHASGPRPPPLIGRLQPGEGGAGAARADWWPLPERRVWRAGRPGLPVAMVSGVGCAPQPGGPGAPLEEAARGLFLLGRPVNMGGFG